MYIDRCVLCILPTGKHDNTTPKNLINPKNFDMINK